eukprot:SAG11_NODE_13205_length_665_cov_2.180212_1_plen_26_part_10
MAGVLNAGVVVLFVGGIIGDSTVAAT